MHRVKVILYGFFLFILAPGGSAQNIILNGSGATFPYPLYRKWMTVYQNENPVRITYQGAGSGAGIRQLIQKSVDFGATDAFLSEAEMNEAGASVLHIPTCVGAVVVTYQLPGNPKLRFTPELLAELFLGRIERWSDPELARTNQGVALPDLPVTLIHRSESSGTTFIFTDYLSRISAEWRNHIGSGKNVRWPAGMGVEGNPGMAEMIKRINGSLGYVELTFAQSQGLPMAALRNRSGRFIEPNLDAVTVAADVAIPPDTRILLTDTPAAEGYPISAFTYIIFFKEQHYGGRSPERARALFDLLWWMLHDGQSYNREMLYAPLPPSAVRWGEAILKSLTYQSLPVCPPEFR